MFEKMKEMLTGKNTRIVFPEGDDPRIQRAARRLLDETLVLPVLLGSREAVAATAAAEGVSLEGMELIDPSTYDAREQMAAQMATLRKGKMTPEQCSQALEKTNYFGTMLVQMGVAQGLLGGATYSTADTVRPALQLVKTRPGCSLVSSCFIMRRDGKDGEERYAMADCAINLDPSAQELSEITIETAKTARLFGIEPRVALLSFSTYGSGAGESVDKMRQATKLLQESGVDFAVDGELQFDAAFVPEVGKSKAPSSPVAGSANTFIFPDINAGNIGYKIAQRLGGFEAIGPILMGLNAPINDLSRGCNEEEIYKMAIITAAAAL